MIMTLTTTSEAFFVFAFVFHLISYGDTGRISDGFGVRDGRDFPIYREYICMGYVLSHSSSSNSLKQTRHVLHQVNIRSCRHSLDGCGIVRDDLPVVVATMALDINCNPPEFTIPPNHLMNEHIYIDITQDNRAEDILLKHQVGKIDVAEICAVRAEIEGGMTLDCMSISNCFSINTRHRYSPLRP